MQEAVDSPLDFIDEQLQCFDQHMRCPICKELYDTPMILATCSHSFCARCIRRSLSQEQVCPQCRISCHDSNLHNNYDLESVVTQWKTTVRSRILQMHASALAAPPPPMHTSSQSSTRDRTMALQQPTEASHVHTQQTRGRSSKTIVIDDDNGDDDFMDMRTWPSAATFSTPTRRSTRTKNEIDPNMSACPVCQQKMHVDVIERHVNRCLEGDSTIPPMPTKSSVLGPGAPKNLGKKPKKIAHDMYKEKDLKMLLKSHDLPDHGDRKRMIWRYREYHTLYNANLDAKHPVEFRSLLKELSAAEQRQFPPQQPTKRAAPDTSEHMAKYGNEFDQLVAHMQKRRKAEKEAKKNEAAGSAGSAAQIEQASTSIVASGEHCADDAINSPPSQDSSSTGPPPAQGTHS